MVIRFFVPGNPKALKRHRNFQRGKFRGTYDPSKGDKSDFLALAEKNKPEAPLDGPLQVYMDFRFARPKKHFYTGKRAHILRDDAPMWHTNTPDADNLLKFVCDALNGIFWKDDKTICWAIPRKMYVDPGEPPGIMVIIQPLGDNNG